MKQLKNLGLYCVIAFSIILCSCGTADKNALPIPIDASLVMHINTKSLSSKLSWEELKKTNWNVTEKGPGADILRQVLANPDTTGIDASEELAFFAKKLNGNQGYFAFTGRLKDAARFEEFNKRVSPGAVLSKDGDITIITLDKKGVASWTGNKFLYLFDAGSADVNNWSMKDSSVAALDTSIVIGDDTSLSRSGDPITDYTPTDLKGHIKNLFKLEGDSMLVDDDRFASLLKKDGDVHIWMNAENTYSAGMPMGFLSMLKLEKYFKESVTAATLNFENGKMAIHAKSFSNKEMTSLFKKYEGNDLNMDLLKRLPSDSVSAVFLMNYKPEGLKEFLKLGGLDGMVNGALANVGITLEDFIAANKGDMLIAMTDFKMKERVVDLGPDVEKFSSKKPDMNFLFVSSVANKAAFDKLVGIGNKLDPNMTQQLGITYSLNNEFFVLGNNKQTVDQYLQGGNKSFAFTSKISGHPVGGYIDLQKILGVFASEAKDSVSQRQAASTLAMWQDVVITGGEFEDGGLVQTIEVNLVDKNTNSLKQLSQYFDKISSQRRGF